MNIRLIKSQTVSDLYNQVQDNINNYRVGSFDFLEEDTSLYFEGQLDINEVTLSTISCNNGDHKEVENCELMFNALKELTPYLARDERLWVYLTHTILLNYSRERWPIPLDSDKAIKHIRSHFFARGARGVERDNAASRLWWMANLCNRVDSLSLREALSAFLFMTDVRANIIERPTTSQSVRLFTAIVKMLYKSLKSDQILFKRKIFRPFMMELNLQGGFKLLDVLDEKEIENILIGCIP